MLAITWKEMEKNLFVFGAYIILTIAMALVFNDYLPGLFEEERDMLAINYSMMLGIFINMIIFGGLMANEKEEDQSNGYEFMRTLPIESWQIVGGKFVSAFLAAIISIFTVGLVTSVFGTQLESKLLPIAFSLFTAAIALVLVGVLYLFAFRVRYSRLLPVIMLVYIAGMMSPQAGHLLMLIADKHTTIEQLFTGLTVPVGGIVFLVGSVLFAGLGVLAVKIKQKTPAPQ